MNKLGRAFIIVSLLLLYELYGCSATKSHSNRTDVYVINTDGGRNLRNLTKGKIKGFIDRAFWVPDKKGIIISPDGGDIYFLTTEILFSRIKKLSENEKINCNFPIVSNDGRKILFVSYSEDPKGEIYIINIDGSEKKRLTYNNLHKMRPIWSPDGERIAFVGSTDNKTSYSKLSGMRSLVLLYPLN